MKPQKRNNTNISSKVGKILLLNILLGSLILLSFKSLLPGILALIIAPFFCKLYLDNELIVNLPFVDHFTSIIFVLFALPGITIALLFSFAKDFFKKANN